MYSAREYTVLPHEKILHKLSSRDIFQFYFDKFEDGKMYNSPFRKDPTPSFNITNSPRGYYFNDFGYIGGDCIKFVETLFGLSYSEACKKINQDFKLDTSGERVVGKSQEIIVTREFIEKEEFSIKFIPRHFTSLELTYWNSYGISEDDLKKYEIHAPKKLWIRNKPIYLPKDELKFIYRFTEDGEGEKKKIYTPYSKEWKWIGNISQKHVEGLKGLPKQSNVVLGTKSRKDRIILSKLYGEIFNTQNEHKKSITDEVDIFLNDNYDAKFLFWDNDETGREANKQLNEKGYNWVNISNEITKKTGCKDPGDIIKFFGVNDGMKILEEELKKKGIII